MYVNIMHMYVLSLMYLYVSSHLAICLFVVVLCVIVIMMISNG